MSTGWLEGIKNQILSIFLLFWKDKLFNLILQFKKLNYHITMNGLETVIMENLNNEDYNSRLWKSIFLIAITGIGIISGI